MKSYTEFGVEVAKDPSKTSHTSPGNQDSVLNQIKANPALIKTNRWKITSGKIPDCLESEGKKYDFMSLSNICDWMNDEDIVKLLVRAKGFLNSNRKRAGILLRLGTSRKTEPLLKKAAEAAGLQVVFDLSDEECSMVPSSETIFCILK